MIDQKDYPNRVISRRRLAPADAVDRAIVMENAAESPLSWLARRGMLTSEQFLAGERLGGDYYRAGLEARVTMRWEPAPQGGKREAGSGAGEQALARLEAKRRFDAAMAAAGPGLGDILWRVVCAGEGISVAEKELGWPARAAKLVLCMALDRLVMHYNNQNG